MPNTREKLINILAGCDCNYEDCEDCEFANDLDGCVRRQKEIISDHLIANGVTVQQWIPVTERLPESECLAVSTITGPAYGEMLIGYVAEASNWDTGYECESDGEILPNVTHWMPLPQPPKGE